MDIPKIVKFWRKHGYYDVSIPALWSVIEKHIEYNTLLVEEIEDEIIGICRFNIDGFICTALDVVIKPEYRNKRLLKLFIIKGLQRFPLIKILRFERGIRHTRFKDYDIYKFLGIKRKD